MRVFCRRVTRRTVSQSRISKWTDAYPGGGLRDRALSLWQPACPHCPNAPGDGRPVGPYIRMVRGSTLRCGADCFWDCV